MFEFASTSALPATACLRNANENPTPKGAARLVCPSIDNVSDFAMQPRPRTKHSDVLIVVPAYNESATIARVAAQLEQLPYDYLVINDGSTDNTAEILRDIRAPHINLCKNLGIGGAVQTGYKFAYANGYDIAVQFDGDGQHDAGCIERLIAPIREGRADFVVGSRFVSSDNQFLSSRSRRTGIFILSKLIQLVTGTRILDVTSGFRAASRRIIKQFVDYYPADYPEPETLAGILAGGMRVQEVGVIMHERAGGTSSIGTISSVYYMIKVGLSILLVHPYERR